MMSNHSCYNCLKYLTCAQDDVFCSYCKCNERQCKNKKVSVSIAYCNDCKCTNQCCPNKKIIDKKYCNICSCSNNECKSCKLLGSNFCNVCRCTNIGCPNGKINNSLYCSKCKCLNNLCNLERNYWCNFCDKCVCTVNNCQSQKVNGKNICDYHSIREWCSQFSYRCQIQNCKDLMSNKYQNFNFDYVNNLLCNEVYCDKHYQKCDKCELPRIYGIDVCRKHLKQIPIRCTSTCCGGRNFITHDQLSYARIMGNVYEEFYAFEYVYTYGYARKSQNIVKYVHRSFRYWLKVNIYCLIKRKLNSNNFYHVIQKIFMLVQNDEKHRENNIIDMLTRMRFHGFGHSKKSGEYYYDKFLCTRCNALDL